MQNASVVEIPGPDRVHGLCTNPIRLKTPSTSVALTVPSPERSPPVQNMMLTIRRPDF